MKKCMHALDERSLVNLVSLVKFQAKKCLKVRNSKRKAL